MKICASIKNTPSSNTARVKTNEAEKELSIEPKSGGRGSSINGGELLFLSLASCYCNDIFREAEEMGVEVWDVEVSVEGNFGGKGEPTTLVNYDVKISANADDEKIRDLLVHTDKVAEIQNTLRTSIPVNLRNIEIKNRK
jgi:uncharacterized OsmC-like protein